MWTSTLRREELIAITQGESLQNKPIRLVESIGQVEPQTGLVGVWDSKPNDGSLPNLLLIPQTDKRDFFAWANAYLGIKPLTAFIRILGFEDLKNVTAPPR